MGRGGVFVIVVYCVVDDFARFIAFFSFLRANPVSISKLGCKVTSLSKTTAAWQVGQESG